MTHDEIMDTLRKRPDIVELITAYKEAKERNPTGTAQALPIILKLLLHYHLVLWLQHHLKKLMISSNKQVLTIERQL